ncbi:MAG: tRNA adenosine(34) deaminase TadA [Phycisphaerae bacterium]|nr:tRNA adenosine(34) deaminase TadA [Phycisphaerae bacterium]
MDTHDPNTLPQPAPAEAPIAADEATDRRMMERAIELAGAAARGDEVPVGAVIYRGADLIAEAHNLRECASDPTAHAEILALRLAAGELGTWRLSDCSMAVTLEPCVMCAGAVVNSRLGRLVYGAADPKAGAVESLYQICADTRLNHRPLVVGGLMADPCGQILRDFFKERRSPGP